MALAHMRPRCCLYSDLLEPNASPLHRQARTILSPTASTLASQPPTAGRPSLSWEVLLAAGRPSAPCPLSPEKCGGRRYSSPCSPRALLAPPRSTSLCCLTPQHLLLPLLLRAPWPWTPSPPPSPSTSLPLRRCPRRLQLPWALCWARWQPRPAAPLLCLRLGAAAPLLQQCPAPCTCWACPCCCTRPRTPRMALRRCA